MHTLYPLYNSLNILTLLMLSALFIGIFALVMTFVLTHVYNKLADEVNELKGLIKPPTDSPGD